MKVLTYGEMAYNAYCDNRKWKSVRGDPLPAFENQSSELKAAWEAAAQAVAEQVRSAREPMGEPPESPAKFDTEPK